MATNENAGRSKARLKPFLWVAAMFSIVVNLLMLVSPLYMLQIYDRVLISGSVETLILVSVLAGGLMITYVFAESARRHALAVATVFLRERFAPRVFHLNFSQHGPNGALQKDLADLSVVQSFSSNGLILPFFDLPFTPFFIAIMFLIHPIIGWIGVGGAVFLFLIALLADAMTRGRETKSQSAEHDAQQFAADLARQKSAIMSMGIADAAYTNWLKRKSDADAFALQTSKSSNFFSALTRGVRLTLQMAALGAGGWLVLQQSATPGVIIAASILLGRALAPIDQCVGLWRQIVRARKSWTSLRERIATPEAEPAPFTPMPRPASVVNITNLSIANPGALNPLFPSFNLNLKGGCVLAIVGPSGAGKTSFLQTLVGAWPARDGQISLDGRDLHTWSPQDRGRFIGYLPQKVELLPGTVVDNIARFTDADSEPVISVAKAVGVHEMISGIPESYDAQLGAGGIHISAGQAQGIGLARAMFGEPVLIALDEPSSCLDSFTVAKLTKALDRLRADGRIIIVATHDPRLMELADQILVLSRNEVKLVSGQVYLSALAGRAAETRRDVSA